MPEDNFNPEVEPQIDRPTGEPARGERTQAEIVASAHRLFIRNGFHGTSMRQIAEEAGIAVGGIYNHFASKEDIFQAVLIEFNPYKQILPAMLGAEGETIEAFLRDAARRMVGEVFQSIDFVKLIFIEILEFNGQHVPELFQLIFPQVLVFAQRFAGKEGELRPIPLPTLVRAFLGLFFSYVLTELLIASQLPPEARENALDYFVDIYLHGILKDGGASLEKTIP